MDGGKYKIIKGEGHIEAHQKKDTSYEQSRNNLQELVWEQDLLMSRENLKVGNALNFRSKLPFLRMLRCVYIYRHFFI